MPPGEKVLAIMEALQDGAQMTRAAIERECGVVDLGQTITRMSHKQAKLPKRIYIADWTRQDEGGRNYLRAVYALGNKPNKPKPDALTQKEKSKNYRRRNKGQVPSVFHLGIRRRSESAIVPNIKD